MTTDPMTDDDVMTIADPRTRPRSKRSIRWREPGRDRVERPRARCTTRRSTRAGACSRCSCTSRRRRWPRRSSPAAARWAACSGPATACTTSSASRGRRAAFAFIRVGYREPNNLDLCAHDLACGVETARDAGADRVVMFGHSFGGAAAIRAAVVMPASVVGVVTFATQSAGCEVAGALAGKAAAVVPRRS